MTNDMFEVIAINEIGNHQEYDKRIIDVQERITELYNDGYVYHSEFSPVVSVTFLVLVKRANQATVNNLTIDSDGTDNYGTIIQELRKRGAL